MKAVIQKVVRSSVTVDSKVVGSIGKGYNVLLGIGAEDTPADGDWIVKKLLSIRLWNKDDGKSGLSETPSMRWSDNIEQADGEILIISQFTLFSQLKGTKVDFHRAMKAADAQVVYDSIVQRLREAMPEGRVQTGTFGAMMQVDIVNDGPVTIQIDSKNK